MNIFLRIIKFSLILTFLGFAFVADAQPSGYEYHHIPVNQTLNISDLPPGIPSIPTNGHPDHGSLQIITINNNEQINYIPDPNYTGLDTFYFQMFYPPNQNIFLGYEVEISNSLVTTKRDFVSTFVGSAATVFPLANDITTTGVLSLKEVSPIYNHGTVNITGNEFEFVPDQGFKGVTHMEYIACNDFGACEKGVISVLVHDYGLPSTQSAEVLTSKNEAIPILLPYTGYTISSGPSNGTLQFIEDFAYLYTPAVGFSGQENFSFQHTSNGNTSTYNVTATVLDIAPSNNFAQDDFLYMGINRAGSINYFGTVDVLDNDSGNLLGWSLQLTNAPTNGIAWLVGNGSVKYVPNINFEGVDKFTYKVANALGVFETATIYVTVSNFTPGATSFDLNTYDDTPIFFEYDAPIFGYNFNIVTPPTFGTANVTWNTIEYVPQLGYSGTETITLEYCINTSDCFEFDINVEVTDNPNNDPACSQNIDECVWAGDTNLDGVVDGKDILYLCAIGEVGTPRNGGTNWIGQFSNSWVNTVTGVNKNIKHIDTDGDSIITKSDANVVDINYGKRNRITPQILPTQSNPLIFSSQNTGFPQPGDTVAIDVVMGTSSNPARDFSGVTFQMNYNPIIFEEAWIEFDEHSWLGYDAPVMSYSKIPFDGKLDVAFTRADETSKSGFGKVGTVYIVVDDITGFKIDEENITTIGFTGSNALSSTGHLTKLNDETIDIQINLSDFDPELRKNALNLYPNPTDEYVTIQTDFHNPMETIRVINMMGQILDINTNVNTNEVLMDVSHLESGVYIIDVETEQGPLTKKLQVFK